MTRYVLDTNLYVEAARNPEKGQELASFVSAFLPFVFLHAVVVQELLAGAVGDPGRRSVLEDLVEPFSKRKRLVIPSWRAWRRSGEIISELVERGELSPGGFGRSFPNDALLAASAREEGHVLVTLNRKDFGLISSVEAFRFVEPWPEPPRVE